MLAALALFIAGLVMFNVGLAGLVVILARHYRQRATRGQGAPRWAPDAAYDPALREDAIWAGIEAEWLGFVDALPETRR